MTTVAEPSRQQRRSRLPSRGQAIALAAALAFTVGATGYVIGGRRAAPSRVDVGFLRDMILHHEQAVEMSKIVLGGAPLPEGAESFVIEVISDQRYEIGVMETILRRWDRATEHPTGTAMAWMGDAVPLDAMPGIADEADLDRLATLTGHEAAEAWFQLMSAHHAGGLGMARAAADRARDAEVEALASRIARNQRIEINEYAAAAVRLGLDPPAVMAGTDPAEQGHAHE